MIGTLINTAAIILGSALGLLLRKGLPQRLRDTVMKGLGLCVLIIGVMGAIKTQDTMVMIISMVLGGIVGALVDIEKRLDQLGLRVQRLLSRSRDDQDNSFAKGY